MGEFINRVLSLFRPSSIAIAANSPGHPTAAARPSAKADRRFVFKAMTWEEWLRNLQTASTMGIGDSPSASALLRNNTDWAYAAISVIAARMMELEGTLFLEKRVKGKIERVPISDHIYLDLIWNPNPSDTWLELKAMLSMDLMTAGVSYQWTPLDGFGGKPSAIYRMPPDKVSIIQDQNTGLPAAFSYMGPTGKPIIIPPEEVVYYRMPNRISPLMAAARAHDLSIYSQQYKSRFYLNNARPDFAIIYPAGVELNDEDTESIFAAFSEKHQGIDKAHLPTILTDDAKLQTISFPSADSSFIETANMTRDKILGIFHVPASKLGLTTDANRANADAADLTFNRECIKPHASMIAARINKDFLSRHYAQPKPGSRLVYEYDNPVPEDADLEMKIREHKVGLGLITLNQAAAELGAEEFPEGDVRVFKSGYMTLQNLLDQPPPGSQPSISWFAEPPKPGEEKPKPGKPAPAPGEGEKPPPEMPPGMPTANPEGMEPGAGEETPPPEKRISPPGIRIPDYAKASRLDLFKAATGFRRKRLHIPEDLHAEIWSRHCKGLSKHERPMRLALKDFFEEQGQRTIAKIKENFAKNASRIDRTKDPRAIMRYIRKDGYSDEDYFDFDAERALLMESCGTFVSASYLSAFSEMYHDLTGQDARALSAAAREWLRDRKMKFASDVTETTRENLRRMIGEGLREGLSVREMSDEIRDLFGEDQFGKWRADTIARTEMNSAMNAGNRSGMRESGVVDYRQWLSALDERTRRAPESEFDHWRAHGEITAMDKPFKRTGESLDGPGDPLGSAGNIINCRCTEIAYFDEVTPEDFEEEPGESMEE